MSDKELIKSLSILLGEMKVEEYGITPKALTIDRILDIIKLREQQIYEWVEREVIGKDEVDARGQELSTSSPKYDCNTLRIEQRAILQAKREGKS